MTSRTESAAATRRSLLDAAAALLDEGGPEAVTLREVGARAGVSRGAPYRHFDDKKRLLTAIAAEAWERLADQAVTLGAVPDLSAHQKLREMLNGILVIGRKQPHLYRLMHKPPAGPEVLRAAGRSQGPFVAVLEELVGDTRAHLYGAMLIAGVHGVIGMEASGQLTRDKWHTDADEILEELIAILPTG
ncbi:TetR family transcriptional regulator [Paractinoplanes abujensis]|uniref:AcrR family transcriptional regulator n=1 Tax=Paractinoplanes abujensis TaxID=882441 RepID=A0A7W7CTW6_9ACTN|nr:TetR/AcrR family transcriptional regulator [Actinoplanes abujensis]MBB4694620.1 AcrR family transcriptional regulator [Actinoplanes abujensis]GID20166.1 TetR family transcriptional regulator [Actinoplanes abujensis]